MNLTIAVTQSYINFKHTVHFILYGVIFYAHSTGKRINTIRFTVYLSKFTEKGVSKVYFHALTVEGYNVSNLYKKYIINLCNHTNFRIFSCTFPKSYQRKVKCSIHKE